MARPVDPAPIEAKVTAASIAAAVSSFALWLLNTYVFGEDAPAPVVAVVTVGVTAVVTFLAGYAARHTPRTDRQAGSGGTT